MKCLVTGGAGFIGSNLVEELLKRGDEVTVIDNFTTGSWTNLPSNNGRLSVVKGDILDFKLVESCVKDVEVVFHLAAEVGNVKSLENPIRDAEVNILGTINLLRAVVASKVKSIVYSSSSAIFGEPEHLPIDESHPLAPESFYAVSKLGAEKYCLAFAKLYNISVVCLRYFNVYGPQQGYSEYANVMPIFTERLLKGIPLIIYGDGEQTRDFVAVQDVVQANLLAAAKELTVGEVFNIGTGKPTTVNQLSQVMQNVTDISVSSYHDPPRQGEVRDSVADITKAKKLLGYKPEIELEEGVKFFFSWYQQNRPSQLVANESVHDPKGHEHSKK